MVLTAGRERRSRRKLLLETTGEIAELSDTINADDRTCNLRGPGYVR